MMGGTFTARRSTSLLAVGCEKGIYNNYMKWQQFNSKGAKRDNFRLNIYVSNKSKVPTKHKVFK